MERMTARVHGQDGAGKNGRVEEVGNWQHAQCGLGDRAVAGAAGPLHSP